MINTPKLNKMYELFIDNEYITTKDLECCGFDFTDILNLLKKGHIKSLGDLKFGLLEVDDLYRYGMRLSQVDKARANECFEKCFKIDSNYQKNLVSLFYNCIISKEHTQALYYLDLMRKTNKLEYIKDSNFYLYLLNIISVLPDNYKQIVKTFTLDDIKIVDDDIRYGNIEMLNAARVMAFEKNFFYSIRLVRDATEDGSYTFYDKVTKTLLSQAGDAEVVRRNKLYELIKFKKYDEALKLLIEKEQDFGLSDYDVYIMKLIKELQQIESSLFVPKKEAADSKRVFDAIDNKNYKYALYLYELHHKNIEDTLHMILIQLCETINRVYAHNLSFNRIKRYFEELDYKNLIKIIRNYLNFTNSIEYEFLVISHIKLDLYRNDNTLDDVKHLLYKIHNGSFKFNANEYVEKFNIAVTSLKMNEAKIYLDIISKYTRDFDISNLKSKIENDKTYDIDDEVAKIENLVDNYKDTELEKRIDEIYNYLIVNKGIVILDYLTYDQRHSIYDIIKTYPDLEVKSLGEGEFKKIYIRYKLRNEDLINYNMLKKFVNMAFSKKQYDIAISYGLQLLQYGYPEASIYSKIGVAFLYLDKPNMAYPYLLVAYDLEQNERLKNQYGMYLKKISSYADEVIFDVDDVFDNDDSLATNFYQNALSSNENASDLNYGFDNKNFTQNMVSKILSKIRRQ